MHQSGKGYGWVFVISALLLLPLNTLANEIWDVDSQTYVNASHFKVSNKIQHQPQTDQVECLWDDTHDSDGDDLYGNYSTCYNLMVSLGYNVTQVSVGPLTAAMLADYDVLVLIDAELDYTTQEITDIQAWIDGGGKLLMIGENTGAFNWTTNNLVISPYNIQFVSVLIATTGATNFNAHPITTGLSNISWAYGSAQTYSTPAQELAWDSGMNTCLTVNEDGVVVVVLNDSNMMDNTYIGNNDNTLCMTNTFNYLASGGGGGDIFVDLTYVSGSPVPPGGGNIFFDVFVENQDTVPLDFDAWIDVEYEGSPYLPTLVLRSFSNYQPGWTINRPGMFFPIPGSWAAGNYELVGRVGNHPDVWAEDGVPFVKEGTADGSASIPTIPDNIPDIFGEPTSNIEVTIPSSSVLHGAYPNPFNPTTDISYQLNAAGHINLTIYDIAGRQVAELVNGWRDAGQHQVTFDAAGLSTGIYVYRLNTGDFTGVGKMVLMK